MATNKKHCLKLLVDNRSQRVLFAEADKAAVDFLSGLLSLPLGSVVKHLNKKCMVGTLGDLYGSFESLSDTHIQLGQNKASSSTQPNSTLHSQVGSFPSAPRNWYNCGCNRYMVMDNLAVMPMSIISCLSLFKKFNIKEVGSLQERVVELGMDEGMKLLQASFQSETVLKDVFLVSKK